MQRLRWCWLVMLGVLILNLVGAQPLPRNETLYKAGMQWGPPANFNPMGTNVAWPIPDDLLIYETLFAYNLLTGELDPVLAQSIAWVDELTAHITLHDGTRWHDGAPLTAEDVVYTFGLGQRYDLAFSTLWDYVAEASAVDERTVRLSLNPANPHRAMVLTELTNIRIVPQHIWEIVEADYEHIREFANLDPVGSGPYHLLRFSAEQVVIERHDDYWGREVHGIPVPRFIVHPIFRSNDAGNLALERGQVDWSQQFVPEVWRMWEAGLPVGTWFAEEPYYIPASIPTLFINVNRLGLDNPLVRRALAHAIDYERIAETAMSRYSPPARSSMIIPIGVPEQQFFSEAEVSEHGWRYDPDEAVRILEEELGATRGTDGVFVLPDGTRLGPFTVQCPFGWTDWMTALEVVAESARAIGIDVRTEFPEAPVWNDRLQTGNFDLILNTPAGGYTPAHPWLRFRDVMDHRGVPDIGGIAFRNWNRYRNDAVPELLDAATRTDDETELADIYRELDRIFMQDIPAIPLMYRPWQFYTFNESVWTNFPTEANPYSPPMHSHTGIQIYYRLQPVNP